MIGSNVSLAYTINKIVTNAISRLVDRVRVQSVTSDRRVSVVSLDPQINEPAPRVHVALKPNINPGDDVVILRSDGATYVLGAIPKAQENPIQYATIDDLPDQVSYPISTPGDQTYVGSGQGAKSGDMTGTTFVGQGTPNVTGADRATFLGSYLQSIASRAVAIGHWVSAGLRSVALGTGASAMGVDSVAIGDQASASGARSIAIGKGASEPSPDTAKILTNRLIAMRSSGTSHTTLSLQSANGSLRDIAVADDNRMWIGNDVLPRRGDTLNYLYPNNKTIASGGATFRSTPVVNTVTQISVLTAGSQVHDTGNRHAQNGYTWAYVYVQGVAFGFVVSSQLI